MSKKLKILMSGGGTGGHIFPAVAIAQEIQKRFPDAEFLFIGANGKMEMEKVPQSGFKIEGLNIAGFDRGNLLKNIGLPFKIISSLMKAKKIIKDFKPDFAVGTGGFASGPALYIAAKMGIPTFIQEQNSLPGKTNVFNAKKAKSVFTAYPDMEKFFHGTKTYFLGNPIRQNIITDLIDKDLAKEKLGLDKNKLTILSVGGSLGSRTLNNGWKDNFDKLKEKDYQLIWQTGKTDFKEISDNQQLSTNNQIQIKEFISDMALAYSAADVIVSRAGAIAISELAVAKKPVLLVPFPFAAEDHQTKNALTLVEKNAARMVKDSEMKDKFWNTLSEICENENLRKEMSDNLEFFAKPKAAEGIVDEIFKVINNIKRMMKNLFWIMSLIFCCSCASDFYKPTPKKFATQERINKAKGFAEQVFGKCSDQDYSEIQGFDIDVNTKKDFGPENLKKFCEELSKTTGKITIGKFNRAITPNSPKDFMDYMVFDAKYEKNDTVKYAVVSLYRDKDFIYKVNLVSTPKPVIRINFRK